MDIRQVSNKKKYDLAASCYDIIAYMMSLGQASKLYKEVSKKLQVPKSGLVVELGCGPGSVVPSLLDVLDENCEITGIDFSSQMIAIANRKKETNGWHNVHFECMDMYEYAPDQKVDTVVFCLALTAMPDYKKAIDKALSILKPGGQLLILDSFPLHGKWYYPIANMYTYLKSLVVGAKPLKEIIHYISEVSSIVENKVMVSGVYTLIDARTKI